MVGPTCQARDGPVKSSDRDALSTPNIPVSEIRGKNAAFASPMCAFAEMSCCSAWRISGRRSSSIDGSPAGTWGGAACASRTPPRGIGSGFRLRDPPLDAGHGRRRGRQLLFGAAHVEFVGEPLFESPPHQLERGLSRGKRPPIDVGFPIELQKIEVALGDIADQCGEDRASIFRAREQIASCRLRPTPEPPPQIELESQVHARAIEVLGYAGAWKRAKGGERKALLRETLVRV